MDAGMSFLLALIMAICEVELDGPLMDFGLMCQGEPLIISIWMIRMELLNTGVLLYGLSSNLSDGRFMQSSLGEYFV